MVKLETARKLKSAGIQWQPQINDYFAIPDRDMDERIFVISDIQATIGLLQGIEVVSFQGASEWALDYLMMSEAVWLPREDQIRIALETVLLSAGRPEIELHTSLARANCRVSYRDRQYSFEGYTPAEAYAEALLYLLKTS